MFTTFSRTDPFLFSPSLSANNALPLSGKLPALTHVLLFQSDVTTVLFCLTTSRKKTNCILLTRQTLFQFSDCHSTFDTAQVLWRLCLGLERMPKSKVPLQPQLPTNLPGRSVALANTVIVWIPDAPKPESLKKRRFNIQNLNGQTNHVVSREQIMVRSQISF